MKVREVLKMLDQDGWYWTARAAAIDSLSIP
jgi:hypothetical protein